MKHIVAIGASNSGQSINKKLATWAAHQVGQAKVTVLDLNDFEMPIYSVEREQQGIPSEAKKFNEIITDADGLVISFAEYNGSYTSAFKNIFDWISRLPGVIWEEKPMMLLSTSPGPRGAQSVLKTATTSFPYQGAQVAGSFSLPSFGQNFDLEIGITDIQMKATFEQLLWSFETQITDNTAEVLS